MNLRVRRHPCGCVRRKDSDQPADLCSLIRIFIGYILEAIAAKFNSFTATWDNNRLLQIA